MTEIVHSESQFVHDIITPLAIAHAHVRKTKDALQADELSTSDLIELRKRMETSFTALERLIVLITTRREELLDKKA